MLRTLSIKNFALIEHLEIDFSEGLSIITGETGAGKSILLGALGLLQGKRADLTSLKNKEDKCVVEGHFEVSAYALEDLYEQLDLDYEVSTIIRREILPSGKSRAFVNDSPVNLNTLQQLSAVLIDIHSQHQTHELSEEQYQLEIVDAIAGNQEVLKKYKEGLSLFKLHKTLLKELEEKQASLLKEQDYNSFLLEELGQANLQTLNQEDLEEEFEKLNNVEFVKEHFSQTWGFLHQEDTGVLFALKNAKSALQKTAELSKDYGALYERLLSTEIELADIAQEVESQLEEVVLDPARLQVIQEQLQLLYALQKKHQVTRVDELLQIEKALSDEAFLVGDLEEKITALQMQIVGEEQALLECCNTLRENRRQAVPELEKHLVRILNLLGMPNATFKMEIGESTGFKENGKDTLELLFSANKGMQYGVLKKVASGGELARIMLAIKSILAGYSNLPTLIFDEIDTGVSGEVADKMGDIMKDMSQDMQVFAITHLPQIASKGIHHYKVFKTSDAETTSSQLILLDKEARIREIAQMLSGKDITDAAIAHAETLLS